MEAERQCQRLQKDVDRLEGRTRNTYCPPTLRGGLVDWLMCFLAAPSALVVSPGACACETIPRISMMTRIKWFIFVL